MRTVVRLAIGIRVTQPSYALRLRAQTLIREGKLPRTMPLRTIAGFGSGRACALGDEPLFSTEPELEVPFHARACDAYLFHRPCYVLWSAERLRAT